MIKKIVGYNGNIVFNKNYPDGVKEDNWTQGL